MIAAMAQWEREEIGERVKASMSVRAKLGKPLGGPSPYGYQWKDRKLVLDPAEAPIRKRAYELFREHHRKGLVARLLNESGYRTRAGCKWSNMAVLRVLRCPSAKGVYYLNRTHKLGSWHHELKPEQEWGTLTLETIVSEELWTVCNRILEEQTKTERRPGRKPSYLFAGLTGCSCGQKMYVKANSPKYVCERCRNKIPMVDLDNIVHEELENFFSSPEKVAGHLARGVCRHAGARPRLAGAGHPDPHQSAATVAGPDRPDAAGALLPRLAGRCAECQPGAGLGPGHRTHAHRHFRQPRAGGLDQSIWADGRLGDAGHRDVDRREPDLRGPDDVPPTAAALPPGPGAVNSTLNPANSEKLHL